MKLRTVMAGWLTVLPLLQMLEAIRRVGFDAKLAG